MTATATAIHHRSVQSGSTTYRIGDWVHVGTRLGTIADLWTEPDSNLPQHVSVLLGGVRIGSRTYDVQVSLSELGRRVQV